MSHQTPAISTPSFTKSVVQGGRRDGYWIETFFADPGDKYPGLIGYGLNAGDICVFDNPLNCSGDPLKEWEKYEIALFDTPVAVTLGDCAGNGRADIIISHNYGATMMDARLDGGHVSWLENPGRNKESRRLETAWKQRFIGRWPSMHRLKTGHFTQRSTLEIVALPIVHGPHDLETPVPIFMFQRDEKSIDDVEWKRTVINDTTFSVIHECVIKRFRDQPGLDSLIIASREGVNRLLWQTGEWRLQHIHDGMPKEAGTDYYGSACVDIGRVGTDESAYMMTIDPFHGSIVTALTKPATNSGGLKWTRHVLDTYGTPRQMKNKGEGPGHHVVTADFDGDGDDECLVALFGPVESSDGTAYHAKGVYYYKAIDLEKGIFAKWKVSDDSAARIAVGKFTGGPGLDFATISYNVAGYYQEKNPQISLYRNNCSIAGTNTRPEIISTVWGAEPLYYIPNPSTLDSHLKAPLLQVANYQITLESIPPHTSLTVNENQPDAIKVLFGEVRVGETARRAPGPNPYDKATAKLSEDTRTGRGGAIIMRFSPLDGPKSWSNAGDIPVKNLFKLSYPQLQLPDLSFTRVDKLPWSGNQFDGKEFYNMTGIYLRFLDGTPLCHVQFWAAARCISAGAHNHSDDSTFFLEIHLSLSTNTKKGGVWYLKPEHDPGSDPEGLPDEWYNKIPLSSLEEHGPLWDQDGNGSVIFKENGAVQYPSHKWQTGSTGDMVDIWAAFEYNPDLVGEY